MTRTGWKNALTLLLLLGAVALLIVLAVRFVHLAGETRATLNATPTPDPVYGLTTAVTPAPGTATRQVLRLGASGEVVAELQRRLSALGYDPGSIDGQYGQGTYNAVVAFQQRNGLEADGVAGPATQRALFADTAIPYGLEE